MTKAYGGLRMSDPRGRGWQGDLPISLEVFIAHPHRFEEGTDEPMSYEATSDDDRARADRGAAILTAEDQDSDRQQSGSPDATFSEPFTEFIRVHG